MLTVVHYAAQEKWSILRLYLRGKCKGACTANEFGRLKVGKSIKSTFLILGERSIFETLDEEFKFSFTSG